jgi:Fe2+ or Zn2+ uptake regulation protein
LVDSGVVRKITVGGREARFDAILTDHDHIRCIRCGRVEDFPHPQDIRFQGPESDVRGWKIKERRVEFMGICPDCTGSDRDTQH